MSYQRRPLPTVQPQLAPFPTSSFPAGSFQISSFPTSSFPNTFPPIPRSISPTRRPLPTPLPRPTYTYPSQQPWTQHTSHFQHPIQSGSQIRPFNAPAPVSFNQNQYRNPFPTPHPPVHVPAAALPRQPAPRPTPTTPSTSASALLSAIPDTLPGTASKFIPLWKRTVIGPPTATAPANNNAPQSVQTPAVAPPVANTKSQPNPPSKRPLPTSPIQNHRHSVIVQANPVISTPPPNHERQPSSRNDPAGHVHPRINDQPGKGWPLPLAPAPAPAASPRSPVSHLRASHSHSDPEESESDIEYSPSAEDHDVSDPPSPQYGIRDLPKRVRTDHDGVGSGSGLTSAPEPESMAVRLAFLAMQPTQQQHQHTRHPHSQSHFQSHPHPNPPQSRAHTHSYLPQQSHPKPSHTSVAIPRSKPSSWPANFAPLPRAPDIHTAHVSPSETSQQHRHQHHRQQYQQQQHQQHQQRQEPSSLVTAPSNVTYAHPLDLDDAPPPSLRRTPVTVDANTNAGGDDRDRSPYRRQPPPRWLPQDEADNDIHNDADPDADTQPGHVRVQIESPAPVGGRATRADIPRIEFPAGDEGGSSGSEGGEERVTGVPRINVEGPPTINISEPGPGPGPQVSVSGPEDSETPRHGHRHGQTELPPPPTPMRRAGARGGRGLVCGQCGGAIIGRIVNAMGVRWHPGCFRCAACDGLLEHVSSYEKDGRPYCHLDYHEKFAPRCYSCKTAIIDERFITLDDPALGKRTYHEQHFFCAECGDPFLAPSSSGAARGSRTGELNVTGDGAFEDDDVGFTVYQGHPYCEACHVRLRMPKCRKCKKSIRDGMQAVEALGGKWCWGCFVCAGCERPFEEPSFFQREGLPFCQRCFSIILKNEL